MPSRGRRAGVFISLLLGTTTFLSGPAGSVRGPSPAQTPPDTAPLVDGITVDVQTARDRLLADEDTDGDRRITIDDARVASSVRGDKRFALEATDGRVYVVSGTYYLSNLLQELTLSIDEGAREASITPARIYEDPVAHISRSIREVYWDGLTRRIDEDGLARVLVDEKMAASGERYLYVPADDPGAYTYFREVATRHPELNVHVERLPAVVTPAFVDGLGTRHGLLSLGLEIGADGRLHGRPFVVPGGRFNEMYGWDSYFEILGLLEDGRVDLAKAMVDNFVYQIEHYGRILNANRTYYLTRSQPPFLTSAIRAVLPHLTADRGTREWLRTSLDAAITEYETVWMAPPHLTETGLSRYYGFGAGPPPEVEPGHFDAIYRPYAAARGLDVAAFAARYREGSISVPELDAFFVHDRCVRESGHDTTYRWEENGDRCADFVTVDLNSLLYKIESDVAWLIETEFDGRLLRAGHPVDTPEVWRERAVHRRALMNSLLWDDSRGVFFDYDVSNRRRHPYLSATAFYPLWAGLTTADQAARVVETVLPALEMPGGLAASAEASRGPLSSSRPARQWDYPNGWAPHQMLAWEGLRRAGFGAIADRLVYRWLFTITSNAADFNGTVPEKYDVVARSHDVFAEYGNVGTEFAYITREGFGWMNASYQVGLRQLSPALRARLAARVPPEFVFR